uniref:Uncharacterized protein n=1 Tax=Rhizophora mucronata TaxID=61149 RepID=A0A2P2P0U5_RHIMU
MMPPCGPLFSNWLSNSRAFLALKGGRLFHCCERQSKSKQCIAFMA